MAQSNNPYIDQGTGVFKNKFGIDNHKDLKKVEYMVSSLNARELQEKPIQGKYDMEHMSAIHGHLLKEVYEWAGKPRTLNFSKKDPLDQNWSTPFCKVDKLKDLSEDIKNNIENKNQLKGLSKEDFVKEISQVYQKVNFLHPFPEGNGRTTQTMMKQLANGAGYDLDFKAVHSQVWNQAAARSQQQVNLKTGETRAPDNKLLLQVFNQITKPLTQAQDVKHEQSKGAKYSL